MTTHPRQFWPAASPDIVAAMPLPNGCLVTVQRFYLDQSLVWTAYRNGKKVPCFTRSECNRFPKFLAKAGQALWQAVTETQGD